MINKHYSLLSSVESDKLEKVIGERFRNEMLFPRKSAIVAFFTNILKQGEGFRMVEDPSELEVLDIFYYAPAPMSFLMAEPSGYFISSGHVLTEATLELPDYHYSDIDDFVFSNNTFTVLLSDLSTIFIKRVSCVFPVKEKHKSKDNM